jgi:hypothetical protein
MNELAEELLFVHAVLKRFAAVDEDDGDFVIELAAQFGVAVHVDVAPGEAAAAGELGEALLHDFTEMTALAGINYYAARLRHAGEF